MTNAKRVFSATHPITGEVKTRTTAHTYEFAVWIDAPAQTYSWEAHTVPKTRSFYAYKVEAGSRAVKAESGILSFHATEALARKAADTWLARGARSTWKATAGVVATERRK
jgi:hypothetical protein